MLRHYRAAVILALAAGHAVAAPFTDEEVEKRMAAGANLSAICRVEAMLNQTLSGQYCAEFMHWVRDDFSQIRSNLTSTTPQAISHLEIYKTNLSLIAGIAKSIEAQAKPAE